MYSRTSIVAASVARPKSSLVAVQTRRVALFDSGASYSIIRRDIAETLGELTRLPEPWEFETAEKLRVI